MKSYAAYAALSTPRKRENGEIPYFMNVSWGIIRAETRARHFSPARNNAALAPTFYCVNSEWSCSAAWHIARSAGNLGGLFTQPFFIINKISMTAPILSALSVINSPSWRFTPPAVAADAEEIFNFWAGRCAQRRWNRLLLQLSYICKLNFFTSSGCRASKNAERPSSRGTSSVKNFLLRFLLMRAKKVFPPLKSPLLRNCITSTLARTGVVWSSARIHIYPLHGDASKHAAQELFIWSGVYIL